MQTKLEKCGICLDWHSPKHHCFNCGAERFAGANTGIYYRNAHTGVLMGRALPIPIDAAIDRAVRYLTNQKES